MLGLFSHFVFVFVIVFVFVFFFVFVIVITGASLDSTCLEALRELSESVFYVGL